MIQILDSQKILELSKEHIPSAWEVTPNMIDLIKEKLPKFSDIKNELLPFFSKPNISNQFLLDKYPDSNINEIIPIMINSIQNHNSINKETLNEIMNHIGSKTGCTGKKLWQPIRLIITGQEHGPDLASFISIIGLEECIKRFSNAL